jgi:hypothetical protein
MKKICFALIIGALALGMTLVGCEKSSEKNATRKNLILRPPLPACARAFEKVYAWERTTRTHPENAVEELAEQQKIYNHHIQLVAGNNPPVGTAGDVAVKLVGGHDDAGLSWKYDKNELQGIVRECGRWNDWMGSCRFRGVGEGGVVSRPPNGMQKGSGLVCCYPSNRKDGSSNCIQCGLMCLAGGTSGVAFYEFQGIKKGSVKIHFIYKRQWEKNEQPLKTADYVLTVDSKGHLTATKQ